MSCLSSPCLWLFQSPPLALSRATGRHRRPSLIAQWQTPGEQRALWWFSPVKGFQHAGGKTDRGGKKKTNDTEMVASWGRGILSWILLKVFFPVQIRTAQRRMLWMKRAETGGVCAGSDCSDFWWRVFTPQYSRNIWCELLMIVGFRGTTVCSVRRERRNLVEKPCPKRSRRVGDFDVSPSWSPSLSSAFHKSLLFFL